MEPESPSIDSIFDFLYVDHVRIAVLLSQLSDQNYGYLESVKVGDEAKESFRKTGALNVLAAKGELESDSSSTERLERSYNPLWLHARQFLDIFEELGFIKRELPEAKLGEIIVASGSLSVTDPRFLRPLWRSIIGAVANQATANKTTGGSPAGLSRQQRRAAARGASSIPPSPQPAAQQALGSLQEVVSGFLEGMPHAIRGRLRCDEERMWFMLAPERMSVSPEELVLKHGTQIPGEWHVAGIVDAIPGETTAVDDDPADAFQSGLEAATKALRQQMGRPEHDYGITPLLIFRKLGSSQS